MSREPAHRHVDTATATATATSGKGEHAIILSATKTKTVQWRRGGRRVLGVIMKSNVAGVFRARSASRSTRACGAALSSRGGSEVTRFTGTRMTMMEALALALLSPGWSSWVMSPRAGWQPVRFVTQGVQQYWRCTRRRRRRNKKRGGGGVHCQGVIRGDSAAQAAARDALISAVLRASQTSQGFWGDLVVRRVRGSGVT